VCFLVALAVFAAFETDVHRERQAEGIAKAKRAGTYQGGQPWARLAYRAKVGKKVRPAEVSRQRAVKCRSARSKELWLLGTAGELVGTKQGGA
jgi:DNA invertase Pin-like site-specific DNA recombinase